MIKLDVKSTHIKPLVLFLFVALCFSFISFPAYTTTGTTTPTIAILEEGDGGDGFINRVEAQAVVVKGNTSNVEAGQTVTVSYLGGGQLLQSTAVVNGIGNWSSERVNLTGLPNGVLTINANVSSIAGDVAGEASNTVNIVTQLPLLSINPIERAANAEPWITGDTDQPEGTQINVIWDVTGDIICRAIVASFSWQCQSYALAEGIYQVTATVTDIAGNTKSAKTVFEIDLDLDNDGIPDLVEGTADYDGDLIPNNLDLDSDGDTLPDALEGVTDLELDGLPNYLDVDSDNDGILDGTETDTFGVDSDLDGIDDRFDVDIHGGADSNLDGISDSTTVLTDTDQDSVPDFMDLDSDNDTLFDVIEADLSDLNMDGYLDPGSTPISNPPNSDFATSGDSIPDFRDLDSNDDGVSDLASSQVYKDLDNGSGSVDVGEDKDQDGISESVDRADLQYGSIADNDLDGIFDDVDLDDDNDGLLDTIEGDGDTDSDGIPNRLDLDSDNDAIPDALEGFVDGDISFSSTARIENFEDLNADGHHDAINGLVVAPDSDGDGVPDYLDLDSDNDELFDLLEADISHYDGLDKDGDGILDAGNDKDIDGLLDVVDQNTIWSSSTATLTGLVLAFTDFDGDGTRDFRDVDSDGDGYGDRIENGDFDRNGKMDWQQNSGDLASAVTGYGSFDLLIASLLMLCGLFRWRSLEPVRSHLVIVASLLVVGVGVIPSKPAYAFSLCSKQFDSCGYVGLAVGLSEVDPEGTTNGWKTVDDSQTGWEIYAGLPLRPHWFGELTYGQLGSAKAGNINPNINNEESIDYSVLAAHLGYSLWEAPRPHNFFAKLGVANLKSDSSTSAIQINTVSDIQLSGTLGWLWQPNRENWFVRGQFDIYDRDAHFLGLSLGYSFHESSFKRSGPILFGSDSTDQKKNPPLPELGSSKTASRIVKEKRDIEPIFVKIPVAEEKPLAPVEFKNEEVKQKTCRIFEGSLKGIRFEKNSSMLTSTAKEELKRTIETLKRVPELIIEIEAHTDSQGSQMYNQWLSEKRAQTVLEYLRGNGLATHQMTSRGYGESFPIASNNTEKNRAINRRVQFQLINNKVCQ